MTIFCTGATGLVGYNLIKAASNARHRVVAVCGKNRLEPIKNVLPVNVDLTDKNAVQRAVLDVFPDVIVNCAAMASPADVDANPELANRLNVELAEELAVLAHHVGARFIHLSTDMVFDGAAAPYKNTDVPTPATLYGTTKLLAEKKILKISPQTTVILRLSHVCGNSLTRRRSHHEKLLRAWAKGEKTACRRDEIKCPLSASILADLILEIILRPKLSGIYHYCGSESVSRYDMARRVAEFFGLDPDKYVEPTEGAEPADMTLDCGALLTRVKTPAPTFEQVMSEMRVPPDLEGWLRSVGGKVPVKRFKL